jgi:hypothetical protein
MPTSEDNIAHGNGRNVIRGVRWRIELLLNRNQIADPVRYGRDAELGAVCAVIEGRSPRSDRKKYQMIGHSKVNVCGTKSIATISPAVLAFASGLSE